MTIGRFHGAEHRPFVTDYRSRGTGQTMADKQGKGSATAQKANAKAAKEGEKNPRKSSAAQAELGKKGARKRKRG